MRNIAAGILLVLFLCCIEKGWAQDLAPVEEEEKVEHADPVYEDLITELGARKGANELNVNFGYRDLEENHHILLSQLEYELAIADNLGFELSLPYSIYFTNPEAENERQKNRIEFLQWAGQYTFYTSATRGISLAVAFQNTFGTEEEYDAGTEANFKVDHIRYLPFLIAAKNWQGTYFLLFSGGPELDHDLSEQEVDVAYELNTAFHYGFSEQDHYLGIELNKNIEDGDFEMMLRPQLILELSDSFTLGGTLGIPVSRPDTRWSAFVRIAYEFD